MEKYLNETKPYLKDIIKNVQKSGTWKVQLTIAINFIYSKDNDEASNEFEEWQPRSNDLR